MNRGLAPETAQDLRSALDEMLRDLPAVPESAVLAFRRLVDVLEAGPGAVVLPSDGTVSTQEAATLLGISRMTVVRLVDRGELAVQGGGVHRRIPVSDVARYLDETTRRRRSAIESISDDIDASTPPDEVMHTR